MNGRRIHLPRLILVALLCWLPRAGVRAQGAGAAGTGVASALAGTVLQPDGRTAASGVIVQLLSERRDSVLARTTSGADGRFLFRLSASTADRRVWLQLLRLGQQPMLDGPHLLSASGSGSVRVVLTNAPVRLAAVDVRAQNACTVHPDSASLVAQLYEEARKALLASSIAADATTLSARYATFVREEDVRGRQMVPVQRTTTTRETSRPFAALTADSLARVGFVYADDDSAVYRAPDANVLLSESFVRTHCFQLVNGTQDRADFVGVGFRPVKSSDERVDIRGTMWLHRTRNVLESVEFSYDPLAPEFARARVGGTVDFEQTASGVWFVKHWELRMPRTVRRRVSAVAQSLIPGVTSVRVLDGLTVTGGDVLTLTSGRDVVYATDGTAVIPTASVVVEAPAALTPAVAIVRAPALCEGNADTTGSIHGRVMDQTRYGVSDVRVTATWKEQFRAIGSEGWSWKTRAISTVSSLGGGYALCNMPIASTITLDAVPAGSRSIANHAELMLAPDARHAEHDFPVQIAVAQVAFGADAEPIGGAAKDLPVALVEFDKRAHSHGAGTFITRDEIVKRNAGSVLQIIRGIGGIVIVDSAGTRRAVSSRGRVMTRGSVKVCVFPVVIDNILMSGMEGLDAIQPKNVYGIEVYFGPATIPHQFASMTRESWCGLIALWTME